MEDGCGRGVAEVVGMLQHSLPPSAEADAKVWIHEHGALIHALHKAPVVGICS
jgi:hypothetical protein